METMFVKWILACICCLILFSGRTIDKKRSATCLYLCACKIFTIDKVLPYYFSFSPYFLLKTSELRLPIQSWVSMIGMTDWIFSLRRGVPVIWKTG